MPTLGLVGSLWKNPFHYTPPFLWTVIFKILCLLERRKMVPGYFRISFFLNICLPCQTIICHLWKIWFPFEWILECQLPGKKLPWAMWIQPSWYKCHQIPRSFHFNNNAKQWILFCHVCNIVTPAFKCWCILESQTRDTGSSPIWNDEWASLSLWAHRGMAQRHGIEWHGCPSAPWHSLTPYMSRVPNHHATDPFDSQMKSRDPFSEQCL